MSDEIPQLKITTAATRYARTSPTAFLGKSNQLIFRKAPLFGFDSVAQPQWKNSAYKDWVGIFLRLV
jgi:hypothetical protein